MCHVYTLTLHNTHCVNYKLICIPSSNCFRRRLLAAKCHMAWSVNHLSRLLSTIISLTPRKLFYVRCDICYFPYTTGLDVRLL